MNKPELMTKTPCTREAQLYETMPYDSAICGVCERRCRILEGKRGFCSTRVNVEGRLYTVSYGNLTSVVFNPIEKKPLFHYWPGSRALSAGSWSCNLRCVFCQNSGLSMREAVLTGAKYTSPEAFVNLALDGGAQGLSFTFNEASCTLFEYMVDCFKLATQCGLYRNLNTNGYMTLKALSVLVDAGLDSLCIDIKGDRAFYEKLCSGADSKPVWRNAAEAKRKGLHVELVNLLIPGANDSPQIIANLNQKVRDELGRDTPIHFTRFYPAYKAREYGLDQKTPIKTLESAKQQALMAGMEFVYIGNIPGHRGENTYCPSCGTTLIERYAFTLKRYLVTEKGLCPECGYKIPVTGKPII